MGDHLWPNCGKHCVTRKKLINTASTADSDLSEIFISITAKKNTLKEGFEGGKKIVEEN